MTDSIQRAEKAAMRVLSEWVNDFNIEFSIEIEMKALKHLLTAAFREYEKKLYDVCVMVNREINLRAENDRLKEALELIAAPKRPDGTYNRSREACEELARKALK